MNIVPSRQIQTLNNTTHRKRSFLFNLYTSWWTAYWKWNVHNYLIEFWKTGLKPTVQLNQLAIFLQIQQVQNLLYASVLSEHFLMMGPDLSLSSPWQGLFEFFEDILQIGLSQNLKINLALLNSPSPKISFLFTSALLWCFKHFS